MKKRRNYFIASLLIISIIIGILLVNANLLVNQNTQKWQSASSISGVIGTDERTLDYAITNNLLINDKSSPKTVNDDASLLGNQHKFSDIWISIKEGGTRTEMTLKDAFSSARNLCGDTDFTSYSPPPNPSHLATEIEISSGRSLQDAINNKEILFTNNYTKKCYDDDIYNYSSCNVRGILNDDCDTLDSCDDSMTSCYEKDYSVSRSFFRYTSHGVFKKITQQCYEGGCSTSVNCVTTTLPLETLSDTLLSSSYYRYWYGTDSSKNSDGTIRWAITDEYCGTGNVDDGDFKGCVQSNKIEGNYDFSPFNVHCDWPVNNGAYYPACRKIGNDYCKRANYGENLEWCGGGGNDGTWASYSCNSHYNSACNPVC